MISTPKRTRFATVAAVAVTLGLVATGCGSGDTDTGSDTKDTESSTGAKDDAMGDPSLPRADEIDGADLSEGTFQLLDTRPPDLDDVAGTAWLAQHDGGTTVTIEVTALAAGDKYMAHLHAKECGDDNGGEHFKFDPDGGDKPPNEVHLKVTADDDGKGFTTVNNDKKVGDAAKSIVLHPTDVPDNRIACADF